MNDVMSAWKVAGDRLTALGSALKEHYEQRQAWEPGGEPTQQEIASAKRRLTNGVQEAFEAMGAAAKDPVVKDDVRRVGQSLAGALSATFAEVSDDLRKVADMAPVTPASKQSVQEQEPAATDGEPAGTLASGSQRGKRPPVEPGA
jgi:hypothetical protein